MATAETDSLDPLIWSVVLVKSREGAIYEGILSPMNAGGKPSWTDGKSLKLLNVETKWPESEKDKSSELVVPMSEVVYIKTLTTDRLNSFSRQNGSLTIPSNEPQQEQKGQNIFKPNMTSLNQAFAMYGHINLDSVSAKNGDRLMEEIKHSDRSKQSRNIIDNYSIPINRNTKEYQAFLKSENEHITNQIISGTRRYDFSELPEEIQKMYIEETENDGSHKNRFLENVSFCGARYSSVRSFSQSQYQKKKDEIVGAWKRNHGMLVNDEPHEIHNAEVQGTDEQDHDDEADECIAADINKNDIKEILPAINPHDSMLEEKKAPVNNTETVSSNNYSALKEKLDRLRETLKKEEEEKKKRLREKLDQLRLSQLAENKQNEQNNTE